MAEIWGEPAPSPPRVISPEKPKNEVTETSLSTPKIAVTPEPPQNKPSQPSAPTVKEVTKTEKTWQEELAKECRNKRLPGPVYNIVSDRRGGRTAWSATVTVNNQNIAAKYWYDGQFLNEAKEDAAQVTVNKLRNPQTDK